MEQATELLKEYGIGLPILIAACFFLTQLLKKPVKSWAEKWAEEKKKPKESVTVWIIGLPFVLAFAGSIINEWAIGGWGTYICSPDFRWLRTITETLIAGGIANAIYAVLEKIEAIVQKNYLDDLTAQNEKVATAQATIATEAVSEAEKAQAQKEAEKAQAKAAKLAEKQAKLAEKTESHIAELQAEIDRLKGSLPAQETGTSESAETSAEDEKQVIVKIH